MKREMDMRSLLVWLVFLLYVASVLARYNRGTHVSTYISFRTRTVLSASVLQDSKETVLRSVKVRLFLSNLYYNTC